MLMCPEGGTVLHKQVAQVPAKDAFQGMEWPGSITACQKYLRQF